MDIDDDSRVKIVCLEQRVDTMMRKFIDEIQETNRLIEELTKQVVSLEHDRLKAQSFIAGAVWLAGILGAVAATAYHYFVGKG
jgi:hypothetical protein